MGNTFFSNGGVNSWNKIPSVVINGPSLNSFKSSLDKIWDNN